MAAAAYDERIKSVSGTGPQVMCPLYLCTGFEPTAWLLFFEFVVDMVRPALGLPVSPISSCAPAHLPTAGSVLSRRGMARTIHGNGIKLIIVTAVLPQLGTVFCGIARVGLLDRCASPPRLAEYGIPA